MQFNLIQTCVYMEFVLKSPPNYTPSKYRRPIQLSNHVQSMETYEFVTEKKSGRNLKIAHLILLCQIAGTVRSLRS